jgi:hypothetical protein
VANAGNDAPTGQVRFLYGNLVIGSANLNGNTASFTASTAGLPPGTYNVTASYAGDVNYGPATSAPIAITLVKKAATTVTVTPASQSLITGSKAAFTATVTGSSPYDYPSGTTTLLYGTTSLETATLFEESAHTSEATFSASTAGVPPGTYSVKVSYSGDVLNAASVSAPVTVTVLADNVTVAASPNPVPTGSSFTLSATVTGNDDPAGTVIFYAGTNAVGSGTLSSGVATITLTPGTLASGTYSVTAYYAGDKNNPSATSPAISLTVD